ADRNTAAGAPCSICLARVEEEPNEAFTVPSLSAAKAAPISLIASVAEAAAKTMVSAWAAGAGAKIATVARNRAPRAAVFIASSREMAWTCPEIGPGRVFQYILMNITFRQGGRSLQPFMRQNRRGNGR